MFFCMCLYVFVPFPGFLENPAVFPVNAQFAVHFREFLKGYRSSAECVEVKFPKAQACRNIADFSVGICDGFLKILMVMGVIAIIHDMEPCLQFLMNIN